ncbi:hypothetical protein A3B45_00380 [Candidatus Daviesbacteria bacterium RIFCSPLOWO2_01_FULL_39_12]|uniref:NAD-dependent epimerase/dehydratase domain-containing protein n=1 Tax=Candidatus Daviesbacteria bacterium RIFCSPLOWO2_01_FULL_39_12 TaxID=1797785 RepID=A0A1F5KNZ9_9BACT|nr:MAG: hypothetical protein A3B45_00380 [Candidatus Daviesbacteria bacterium RIFCSPLOWO2_01_FULL_39_12]
MKKRILVTGGEGFIGSHLIDRLISIGFDTASFDAHLNFIDNHRYFNRCFKLRKKHLKVSSKIYRGDIRNKESIQRVVADFSPEVVVHLAALPMARVSEKYHHDMRTINLDGTLNVLEVFEQSQARKIIYTSSSMAYGHFKQTPIAENNLLTPENLYGATKAAGEYFVKLSKKDWVIIRPTSVYGFTDCSNRVTQLLIDTAILKKPAWIIKGEILDFSYIDDVVDGFIKCITLPQAIGQTFNISKGEGRAVSEFAKLVKVYFPKFSYQIRKADNHQVWRGSLDISKAKRILGFTPKYRIEEGIQKILELIKEYNFYKGLN